MNVIRSWLRQMSLGLLSGGPWGADGALLYKGLRDRRKDRRSVRQRPRERRSRRTATFIDAQVSTSVSLAERATRVAQTR
jgi:hypothetical protein